jgi:hypothetical protein
LRYYGRVSRRGLTGSEESGVSSRIQNLLGLAVAILTVAGCAYFYIVAVLDEHRALSRSAALAFFLFSVVAAIFFRRIL